MKSLLIQILSLCCFLTSCNGQNSKAVQTIDAKTFADKLKLTETVQLSTQLLDVRTPEEYNAEHIDKANNVNWNGNNFVSEVEKLDKTKPVFVYCKVGGRSGQAANKLAELGFTEIYNLDGGIMKWNAAGFAKPIDKKIGMTKADFEKLINSDKKVLIDVYAVWCGPCKKMTPYLEKMKTELKGELTIIKIDADQHKSLCQELKIDALPTLLLYKKGKEVWKNIGYISEENLRKQL